MANKKEDWAMLKKFFEDMQFKIEDGVLIKYLVDFGNPAWLPKEIKVPDKVTTLAENAFWDAYTVKKVYLPVGIVAINKNAFANCSKLKEIVFEGTASQWNNVYKHPYAFSSSVKITCQGENNPATTATTAKTSKSTTRPKPQKATTNTCKPNTDDYFIDVDTIDENTW